MVNQKKLRTRLRSQSARDVRLKRIDVRRWRLEFTTFTIKNGDVAGRRLVGKISIFEGRTLRSVAMQAGVA